MKTNSDYMVLFKNFIKRMNTIPKTIPTTTDMRVIFVALFHSHLSVIFHLPSISKPTHYSTNKKPHECVCRNLSFCPFCLWQLESIWKKMCDDYLVLIVHSPSPTINSSLNCGINDNKTPNVKAGIVPKYNDGLSPSE